MFVNSDIKTKAITYWLLTIYLLLIFMIAIGGLTRLTDSGLSITQWELFKGILPPINSNEWNIYFEKYKKIPEFIYLNSDISLNEFKFIFYWEYFHRLLGRIIGLVCIIPLIYFFFKYRNKNISMYKYTAIFFLVCLQGIVGWYMVESGLVDRVDVSHYRLATHLSLAFVILSLTLWYIFQNLQIKSFHNKISSSLVLSIFILIFLQIILGAFLAGLDGGLIYNTWPDMNGDFLPNDSNAKLIFSLEAFSTPSIVQFIHRNTAYILLLLVFYFNLIYIKSRLPIKPLLIFDLAICFQIILGIVTLLSGAKIIYASLHQIGSILVVSSFLFILYKNFKTNLPLSG